MSKEARRTFILLFVLAIAGGIVAIVIFGDPSRPGHRESQDAARDARAVQRADDVPGDAAPSEPVENPADQGESGEAGADADTDDAAQSPPGGSVAANDDDAPAQDAGEAGPLDGLHAVAPDGPTADHAPLGSFDWTQHDLMIEFSTLGAGVERITLADIWNTSKAKRTADEIKARYEAGEITMKQALAEMPAGDRYVIQRTRNLWISGGDFAFPPFAARTIWIDSVPVNVSGVGEPASLWSQNADDPGLWVSEIRNGAGTPIARVTRHYRLGTGSFDLVIEQRIENLTDAPFTIQFLQDGPGDLDMDRARFYDRRRVRIGHLGDVTAGASAEVVFADRDFLLDRGDAADFGLENLTSANRHIWPNEDSANLAISWFATENRYFTVAVHPVFEPTPDYALTEVVQRITPFYDGDDDAGGHDNVAYQLRSPSHEVAPGGTVSLDFAVYAGPLDRAVLGEEEPYASLNMDYLILYEMSTCCAQCTFQWLAHLLLWFLDAVHVVAGDWGVAIICLVVVVRLLLHPITKKSQVTMQRFGRAMQKLAPEIEKIKKKYPDDAKRQQQEQMRLYREYGLNPMHMLGCLPMFLQMPIWIALYAMLYFAWDLRQQPAFWGVFQLFGDWQFLADLSSGDHFFWEFDEPFDFLMWNVTGLNLLPLLMGFLFFVQQKYMTPPTTATMSPEQQQTQKMMRVMMVVMMPLFLYSAPSGLTLYILTSSLWGIIESRMIRKHIDEMDVDAELKKKPKKGPPGQGKKKPRNPFARAQADALERARQRAAEKKRGPQRSYKRRK